MTRVSYTIKNEEGLHARPASDFCKAAGQFNSKITVIKDGKEYEAKSILNILCIGAVKGDVIEIKAEGDDEECHAGEDQNPAYACVVAVGEDRDGEHGVAGGHNQQTADDGGLIFLCAVGNHTARQTEHINQEIEHGINPAGGVVADAEFGAEKQQEHGVHNVVAEALAHVCYGCRDEAFGVVAARLYDVEYQQGYHHDEDT